MRVWPAWPSDRVALANGSRPHERARASSITGTSDPGRSTRAELPAAVRRERERPPAALPSVDELIGFGWLYALNARAAIARGKPWPAEYWISGLRDQALALAGLPAPRRAPVYARGIDRLPREVVAPYERALVGSLAPDELRRALAIAGELFISEVGEAAPELAERLRAPLREAAES
jgi:hypothetical protein